MVYVYILKSLSSGVHYVGMAKNLKVRLKEHNVGKSKFTKGHRPWEVIYSEQADDFFSWAETRETLQKFSGEEMVKEGRYYLVGFSSWKQGFPVRLASARRGFPYGLPEKNLVIFNYKVFFMFTTMVYVYILKSLSSGVHHVDMAKNLKVRHKEHNAGKSKYTKGHRPWELI